MPHRSDRAYAGKDLTWQEGIRRVRGRSALLLHANSGGTLSHSTHTD